MESETSTQPARAGSVAALKRGGHHAPRTERQQWLPKLVARLAFRKEHTGLA